MSELVSEKSAEEHDRNFFLTFSPVPVAIVNNEGNLVCCGRIVSS